MRKIIITTSAMIIALQTFAQTVTLERPVELSDTSDLVTVNSSNVLFTIVLDIGVPYAIREEGANVKFWGTHHDEIGFNLNYRIADFFSVGGLLTYLNTAYSVKQDEDKLVADTTIHNKEKIQLQGAAGGIYFRFTYDKGIPGKYVDAGVKEFYAFGYTHAVWDEVSDQSTELITHKPKFINPLQTYAFISLGFNGVGIFVNYRITDVFKAVNNLPELPRLSAGVEFNFGG